MSASPYYGLSLKNAVCYATQTRFAQMKSSPPRIDGPKVWELWHVRAILKYLRRP